jgi:hypothetical protein
MNFLICVLLAVTAPTAPTTSPTVPEIVGTVFDYNGKPETGVPISVVEIYSGQEISKGTSRGDGSFDFAGLPQGTYGVTAKTASACAFSTAIKVAAGYTTAIRLRLIPGLCKGVIH